MTTQWFEGSVSPTVVETELRRHVPELLDGRLQLAQCKVSRIRSVPETGAWTAIYELTLHDDASGVDTVYATRGLIVPPDSPLPDLPTAAPFGAPGWTCTLPELHLRLEAVSFDDDLPGLTAVTDPVQARVLLGVLLRGRASPSATDHTVESVEAHVVSEKPGVRATLICDLTYTGDAEPSADWPAHVVAKAHHDDEGARAYAALVALQESGLGADGRLGIARPLGYVPELRLAVQEHVAHEQTLKDVFQAALKKDDPTAGALVDAMRRTAAGLADLHTCGSTHGSTVAFAEELAIVRAKYTKLAEVLPTLEARLGPALDLVEAAATSTTADPVVQVHHSFRPAQVLLGDRVSFIDFDKSCQAEPASDIASLTTKLLHMGVNKIDLGDPDGLGARIGALQTLRDEFVATYAETATVSPTRLALWEAYELVSLVLSAAKKSDHQRIDRCLDLLEQHLAVHALGAAG